jgi:hypothetical protein
LQAVHAPLEAACHIVPKSGDSKANSGTVDRAHKFRAASPCSMQRQPPIQVRTKPSVMPRVMIGAIEVQQIHGSDDHH